MLTINAVSMNNNGSYWIVKLSGLGLMVLLSVWSNGQSTGREKIAIITIDPGNVQQTMHSFGASDCWSGKFIGAWTDETKKNQVADWLFSTDTTADGSPKGIGLSLWRFNIGGGSYEQNSNSGIGDVWRREECFLNEDGSYNWTKQQGQQWFLQAARQRGVPYTLGFSQTPPVFMTKNGKAFNGSGGANMNIREGKMNDYAVFLATVTKHFGFDYLSPVNEPQWTWGQPASGTQEGTPATNKEIAALVKLTAAHLKNTKQQIVVGEAGQWNFLYTNNTDGRGEQVDYFFSPSSPGYIGNLPQVAHTIAAHSYFTTCPADTMLRIRQQVASKIKQVDPSLQTWQSEFCVLGNICQQFSGSPRNTGIGYGLYIASVIHHDLTVANVTSWQWWLAISPYNYNDGLVFINDPAGRINPGNSQQDGTILDSKQLWCLGNYSRFIRPGMQRVKVMVQPASATDSLLVSAYKEPGSKKLVLVMVNLSSSASTLQLETKGKTVLKKNYLELYTTDAGSNLKKSAVALKELVIPGRSVQTIVCALQ